jgi:hypothetical protein
MRGQKERKTGAEKAIISNSSSTASMPNFRNTLSLLSATSPQSDDCCGKECLGSGEFLVNGESEDDIVVGDLLKETKSSVPFIRRRRPKQGGGGTYNCNV